ncbi:MAG: hypothetical protein MZV64_62955 [Ignavibacteriales bacterium]|nr:hypothetical protein [Ignavibacteriales bacterium]
MLAQLRKSIETIKPLVFSDPNLSKNINVLEYEIQFWEQRYSVEDEVVPSSDHFNKLIELQDPYNTYHQAIPHSVDILGDEKTAALAHIQDEDLSSAIEEKANIIDRSYQAIPLFLLIESVVGKKPFYNLLN